MNPTLGNSLFQKLYLSIFAIFSVIPEYFDNITIFSGLSENIYHFFNADFKRIRAFWCSVFCVYCLSQSDTSCHASVIGRTRSLAKSCFVCYCIVFIPVSIIPLSFKRTRNLRGRNDRDNLHSVRTCVF